MFLRQSTASQEILLGPFVDSTDGNTAETALTIANTDIKIFKEGGTTLLDKNSGGATHISNGYYSAVLDATDTNTVGQLEVNVKVAGALAVRRSYQVVEEAVYDALFASGAAGYQVPIWSSAGATVNLSGTTVKAVTDRVTANTDQWNGTGVTTATVRADLINIGGVAVSTSTAQFGVNVVNWGGTAIASALVRSNIIQANGVAVPSTAGRIEANTTHWGGTAVASAVVPANCIQISGDAVAADNAESFFDGTGYAGTGNVIPTVSTVNALAANSVNASALATDAVTEIQSGLATASALSAVETKIDTIDGIVDAISVDTGTTLQAELDGIQADTEDIQSRLPAALVGGRMDVSVGAMANDVITSSAIAVSAVTEIQSGLATASQIPAEFTSATFASTGVFATAALANAPSGSGASVPDIVDGVLDALLADHDTPGTVGAGIAAAGNAGDPWQTYLPGSYVAGQAGWIIDVIYDKALLITTQPIYSSNPVNANGEIDRDIVIGSDYLAANGQAFKWTVPIPTGYVAGTSSCKFGGRHVRSSVSSSWNLTGTVSDNGNGTADLSFDMTKIVSGELLSGLHHFSVDFINAGGTEITSVKSGKLVNVVEKQT